MADSMCTLTWEQHSECFDGSWPVSYQRQNFIENPSVLWIGNPCWITSSSLIMTLNYSMVETSKVACGCRSHGGLQPSSCNTSWNVFVNMAKHLGQVACLGWADHMLTILSWDSWCRARRALWPTFKFPNCLCNFGNVILHYYTCSLVGKMRWYYLIHRGSHEMNVFLKVFTKGYDHHRIMCTQIIFICVHPIWCDHST